MGASLKVTCIAAWFLTALMGQDRLTENTLKLESEDGRLPAAIEDIAWLAGYWQGEGLGGEVEEVWTIPQAGSMIGSFRLIQNGKAVFSEALQLQGQGDSLVLRVKHFTPDFVGWEDKTDSVDFRLIHIDGRSAFFSGLTFRSPDTDTLLIYLAMKNKDGTRREEVFHLKRFDLKARQRN